MMQQHKVLTLTLGAALLLLVLVARHTNAVPVQAGLGHGRPQPNEHAQHVIDWWTPARRADAIPRDLAIDHATGKGYMRMPDGSFEDYGAVPLVEQLRQSNAPGLSPTAKPTNPPGGGGGGADDNEPPVISNMNPVDGTTIGGTATSLSATIVDQGSGVKTATFWVLYPDGATSQSFTGSSAGNDIWSVSLSGFTDGAWSWHVEAKDAATGGGNVAVSPSTSFIVDSAGSPGDGDDVANAGWAAGGVVQNAAGRIYFQMPARRRGQWDGYVCSGTVANDANVPDRSIIITAAHCVYDDSKKVFARNVLFIPNQDGTSSAGTDLDCTNDPLGCWTPSFGVVDVDWTTRRWPDNIPWDYAFYVVNNVGAHTGAVASSDVLDEAAGAMTVTFDPVSINDGVPGATSPDFTHALGYSYSDDPNFMYCAGDIGMASGDYFISICGLSGGASGGPWVQPMNQTLGDGPIMSVNSWGYTDQPGMGGPPLSGNSASCVFSSAQNTAFGDVPVSDGQAGVIVSSAC